MADNWPRKGDQVFGPAADWHLNACLYHYPVDSNSNLGLYAEGYRRAANMIVDRLRDERDSPDYFLYPVAFLYRQCLELNLKLMIQLANQILDIKPAPAQEKKRGEHRVSVLWTNLKGLAARIDPIPQDVAEALDSIIPQIAAVDDTSMAFRYPVDLHGQGMIPTDMKLINLGQLQDCMSRVANFFECAAAHYGSLLDGKREP